MTIEFMVLSAPRSASTWCANWLTTEKTLCLHDPSLTYDEAALDALACDRTLGIADTAFALNLRWINQHPARKLIVHRDRDEIDKSLVNIGLTPLGKVWDGALRKITGVHVGWLDLFSPATAAAIYEFLTRLPFDAPRHENLVEMHVEPVFDRLHLKPARAVGFRRMLQEALRAT